jgi:hypothetical protein
MAHLMECYECGLCEGMLGCSGYHIVWVRYDEEL